MPKKTNAPFGAEENVPYVRHHVEEALVAAVEARLPRLALFLQLPHFLGHLHDDNKKHVTRDTLKATSKNRIIQFEC